MGRHFKSALIGGLAGVAALFASAPGQAAEFPARPIRLLVPYSAGGPTDVVGRVVADFLSKDLKQPTFVENKGGAQGAIGAEAVARSEADGYTLLVVSGSMFVLNPMLYKKLAYDPDRDFRTLAIVTEDPLGGQSLRPGKVGGGVRGLRQATSGKPQLQFGGDGWRHSSRRRDVQADDRHRDDPCAL